MTYELEVTKERSGRGGILSERDRRYSNVLQTDAEHQTCVVIESQCYKLEIWISPIDVDEPKIYIHLSQ